MARVILFLLGFLPQYAIAAPVIPIIAAIWSAVVTYGMVAMTIYSLYSSVNARRKARAEAAKARSDYLASLTDRRITVLSEESPRQVIYGEPAPLGGRIVAVLSSGDIDQFRHVVVMFAAHECDGFVDVLIDNDSAFPLDASGWSTSGKFNDTDDDGTANADDDDDNLAGTAPRLNIQLHTSTGGVDTADAFLMAACPEKWTAAHKASGYTYAVITFDLRLSRFQGGIPNITARLRGKKLYDPRTGLTAYSRNAALCTADFIQSTAGYGAKLSQFDLNDLIAAANASERGYNCDGAFSTDQDRDTTRQQLEDVMAGATLESGGVWRVLAGAWSSPLIALDDDDQLARPEVLQTCYPGTDRHNGAKGSYIKANGDGSAIDFPPYQNAVFRDADGKDKFMDLTLPFVGHATQCRQLAMIRTEQSRGGLMLKITPKMLAWHLQPGDRLTLTSKFLGFINKPFRVQDWSYSVASPLALQVIEDEESFYDEAEEQNEDPAPNADLPNPFIAASPPSSLAAASGPDWMVQQGDTLVARVRLSWDASGRQDVLSTGRTQVQWRLTASGAEWQAIEAPGNATSTVLLGLQTGATYDIRARFVTALSTGTWANVSHTVLGLVDDPAAVAGLALTVADAGIGAAWQAPRELDLLSWAYTELRLGATWADGSVAYSGKATTALLPWMPAGNNLVWAAHANTVGGWSQSIVAALNVLAPGQPVVSAEVQGKAIHLSWPDVRTTQPLEQHRIYVGASLATAVLLGYAGGSSFDHQESTPGTRTYWVVPYDKGGNAGAAGYIAVQSLPSIDDAVAELEDGLDAVTDLIGAEVDDRTRADIAEEAARLKGDADERAASAQALAAEHSGRVQAVAAASVASAQQLAAEHSDRVQALAAVADANAQGLADEQAARVQGINTVAAQLQQQIQTLQAQIGDILGAEEYAADQAYAVDDLVVYGGKLYRAVQASIGVGPADGAYWQLIGDYASIADAVVAQAAQISEASSRITQIGSDVTALSSAQTSLAGRLTTAEGSLSAQSGALATLQQSVSSQGGTLASNSSAITSLTNKLASRPNLLPNGSFERGLKGWSGLLVSGESSGWMVGSDEAWGFRALRFGFTSSNMTTGTLHSDPFPVRAGTIYTITGDSLLLNAIAGDVGFDLYFLDSSGNFVDGGDGPNNVTAAWHDFSTDDAYRNLHAVAYPAPAGAAQARARFIFQGVRGGADCVVGCRQIKVEAGSLPATPYSMEAALAAESAAATLLEGRVTTTEGGLASASSSLTNLTTRVGSVESQSTAQSGAISGLQSDVSSINGALTSHTSQLTNLQGSVSSLQSGKADAGALSSLEGRVSATEGGLQSTSQSLTSLTNRMTDTEGLNAAQAGAIGGLQSEVSSANGALSSHTGQLSNLQGSVTSLQSEKADAGALQSLEGRVGFAEGNLSSTSAAVTALTNKIASRPNLLPNGSFERGKLGWYGEFSVGDSPEWGGCALRWGADSTPITGTFWTDSLPVQTGAEYTITGDSLMIGATAGKVSFDLVFTDAGGAWLPDGDGPNGNISDNHNFSSSDSVRNQHAVSAYAPANAIRMVARFVYEGITGTASTVIGCRMVKVERGGLPATPYSTEATLAAESAAATLLQGRVTATEAGLASTSSSLTNLANRVGSTESQNTAQSGAISGLLSDVSSINGALSSHTSQLTNLEGSVSSLQSGKADAGALSSLEGRVSAAEGGLQSTSQSVTSLTNRMTDTEGLNAAQAGAIGGLQSEVSSANGTLSSHTSQLSNLQGSVSSLQSQKADAGAMQSLEGRVVVTEGNLSSTSAAVTALTNKIASRPNLLPNGSFERGKLGWYGEFSVGNSPEWGGCALRWGADSTPITGTFWTDSLPVQEGAEYTITGDSVMIGATAGKVSFDLIFKDAAGVWLPDGDGPNGDISDNHNFSSSDSSRGQHAVSVHAPANASDMVARFVYEGITGTSGTVVGCRMVKVERGGLPATSYSTEATLAAESAAATLLQGRVTATEAGLASTSSSLTNLANRVGSTESQNTAQSGAISGLLSDVSSINGALSSHTSQLTNLEGSVSSLQSGKADAGALSSLEGRVSATEGGLQSTSSSLTNLTNRVTGTEGVNSAQAVAIGGLQSDVSSANGTLSSHTSQLTSLTARLVNRPNLLPNGGFELGTKGWHADGWNIGDTSTWGQAATRSNVTGTVVLTSEPFPLAGPAVYTITGDSLMLNATAGLTYFDLIFYDANWNQLKDGYQHGIATVHDFSTGNESRDVHAVSDEAPVGTAFAIARFVAGDLQGANVIVGCRMVKVERGGLPATGYSAEATVTAEAVATSSLAAKVTQAEGNIIAQASQYTGLSSEVAGHAASISQQGSTLASLNGQIQSTWSLSVTAGGKIAGAVISNTGTVSKTVFLTDVFAVAQNDEDTGKYPFVVGTVGGAPAAVFNADLYVDGGIQTRHLGADQVTADKMRVTQLSAVSANMGDVTAGVIRNPSATNFFNLNATGGEWAVNVGGGKLYATADGYVEADRVNIRRRDVIATGNVYWGGEWVGSGGGNGLLVEGLQYISGVFIIDTGIDLSDASDFGVVQPYYAIAACNNASTSGGGSGSQEQFSLTVSCEVALASAHRANSGTTPSPNPRLRIIVRPHITLSHPSLWRIQLNTFNWSLFRI